MIKRSRNVLRRTRIVVCLAGANLLATAASAVAQPYPGGTPPPVVGGKKFFPDPAKTGTDVLMLIVAALLVLLIGLALRRLARRAGSSES